MKMLEEEKKQPDQEAISKMEACACLHLPRPPAALMLLMPKPAGLLPAYIPHSSSGLKSRLWWKPPDNGEDTRQHAFCAVNKKTKTSVTSHSPKSLVALTPLVTSPALPQACSRCLSIFELAWQIRCKPPNTRGKIRQLSIRTVNAKAIQLLTSAMVRIHVSCLSRPSSCHLGCARVPWSLPLPCDIHLSFRQPGEQVWALQQISANNVNHKHILNTINAWVLQMAYLSISDAVGELLLSSLPWK